MNEDEKAVLGKTSAAATIGATAGIGLATLFGAPLLVPALIGAGVCCLFGAGIELLNNNDNE